ncbi:uncharacterized protein LOC124156610 [Ischnura elegans]|uniref:uncharacterized protein LOC124156610 n=1 Tax=Ischnura elegans TaxID=197161 RepID=UPI001ED8A002|nr:uncharacterized protein LOC124156610 [Ischnura elegans]
MKLLEEFKALTLEHKACIKAHQREIDEREALVESRVKEVLSKIFTDGQISLLLSDKKQVKCWTSEEIGRAFSIRYLSKRCYIHLRNQMKFPLPVFIASCFVLNSVDYEECVRHIPSL